MPHNSEDVYLTGDPLNVIDIVDLPLIQDFDGHFLTGEYVVTLLHFAEGALSERLLYFVVADQLVSHVYDLLVLLAPNWYHNFCFFNTCFKLK